MQVEFIDRYAPDPKNREQALTALDEELVAPLDPHLRDGMSLLAQLVAGAPV